MIDDLADALALAGLIALGSLRLTEEEAETFATGGNRGAVLVGNAGPAMWDAFTGDGGEGGGTDPLDSWTRARVAPVAARFGLVAIHPFDGPPWPPFGQWAARTGRLFTSPLGMQIHRELGIWVAFRAVLAGPEVLAAALPPAGPSPCTGCARPCLAACPVEAFDGESYDVGACRDHVAGAGSACRETGCLARHACPVNPAGAWSAAQARFHMASFLAG